MKDVIVEKIDNIKSLFKKLINWCNENQLKAIIIGFSFVIILLIILLIISIAKNPKEEKKDQNQIVFTQDLMIPDELQKEYNYELSREKKDNWETEETDKWFTIPTDTQIEQLSNENDKMISDVIGAAP